MVNTIEECRKCLSDYIIELYDDISPDLSEFEIDIMFEIIDSLLVLYELLFGSSKDDIYSKEIAKSASRIVDRFF